MGREGCARGVSRAYNSKKREISQTHTFPPSSSTTLPSCSSSLLDSLRARTVVLRELELMYVRPSANTAMRTIVSAAMTNHTGSVEDVEEGAAEEGEGAGGGEGGGGGGGVVEEEDGEGAAEPQLALPSGAPGQSLQAMISTTPPALSPYLPRGQLKQLVEPKSCANLPAGHSVHEALDPVSEEYFPASQLAQEARPDDVVERT